MRIRRARVSDYVIEDVDGVRTLVVTGPWSPGAELALIEHGADSLALNYARGFVGDLERGELEFLHPGLPIRRLALLDPRWP